MYDVIIVGKGPAGVSAALYTARANFKTLIIGTKNTALMKASRIENYYGFVNISGEELFKKGIEQVGKFGAEVIDEEVVSIKGDATYDVVTTKGSYESRTVLLATGQQQNAPKIDNLVEFEGKGISYCTTCDGFFYTDMRVGVIGYKDYAFHEALELEAFTKDITIFTNGNELEISKENVQKVSDYKIEKRKITRLSGENFLETIIFEDGTEQRIDGIFVAYGIAASTDFAKKLGVITTGKSISVDKEQRTNLQGVFAAGDCVGGFKQISVAVGQGAVAAKGIIEYLRSQKTGG